MSKPPVAAAIALSSAGSTASNVDVAYGAVCAAQLVLITLEKVCDFFSSGPEKSKTEDGENQKRQKFQSTAGGAPNDPWGSGTGTVVHHEDDEDTKDAEDDEENCVYLFHYTSEASKDNILRDLRIRRSRTSSGRDANHGNGVYLTLIPPEAGKQVLMHNNYDSNAFIARRRMSFQNFNQRVNWYFKFNIKHLRADKLKDVSYYKFGRKFDVWMYEDDIDLTGIESFYGETPD